MGKNVSFRPLKYTLPFNITRYHAKVDLKENRQPTGVKMANGIVSANNFHIFSESDDHFFPWKMRFNIFLFKK